MASIRSSHKSCAINPLKMSAPLGGAMAFMGLDGCMPLLHGSQGCTAFGLVLLVRHFREAIPFQTTAMNEVTTILGGLDNLEQAVLNIAGRAKPKVIGICSTGLVETRGEDLKGDLKLIRQRHPELAGTELVHASTPDFSGALQDGWSKAVAAMIEQLVPETAGRDQEQVNILTGCHLTPGDIEEIRELVEAFGLSPIILPDLSGSLDGHVPDIYKGTTFGGTTLDAIRRMGRSSVTLAIGEQMRPAAKLLESGNRVPFQVFPRLTGLQAVDGFVKALADLSGRPVPDRLKRRRSQLVDAMLDGHFYFGGKRVAIAAEPDLLFALGSFLAEMGAEIGTAVTSTTSPLLETLPADEVVIGDLDDWERGAADCDLLIAHAHGRQAAERLHLPLFRAGFPLFDRLGAAHRVSVGYRGTRDLIFEIGAAHGTH
ncbi:MAG: nitrogenase iron-molybdenum cofactor biosynthesis protein NifN, partial [Rhodospirillales bacterium]|nr:nitrogenase iron-molybdenum cofactor biosynthesis protein NifN [Rhodospirillales bacterium]